MKIGWLALLLGLLLIAGAIVVQSADMGPDLESKAVKKVLPNYPPLAKRRRIEGKVVVGLRVNGDGSIGNAEFLEGNPLFKPVSLEAAEQWSFQKSASGMNGHITFNFKLEE